MKGTRWVASSLLGLAAAVGVVGTARGEPRLPVVSLSYDGVVGSTETEEEVMDDSSYRHEVDLQIREEWSRAVVSTLAAELVRKLTVIGSSPGYTTIQLSPQLRWKLTDSLAWNTSLLVRRALYDEPYAAGEPRDYTRLRADGALSVGLAKGVTLVPRLLATLELYDDPARSKQSYALGVSLDARFGQWSVGADYRGDLRLPLGALNVSTATRLDHSFGAGITWDPNR
jgi:hypothetical protein